MTSYRLFFIGGHGHFQGVLQIDAADDEASIAAADKVRTIAAMELWQGLRMVREWPRIDVQ
jgi:hypothetical protein